MIELSNRTKRIIVTVIMLIIVIVSILVGIKAFNVDVPIVENSEETKLAHTKDDLELGNYLYNPSVNAIVSMQSIPQRNSSDEEHVLSKTLALLSYSPLQEDVVTSSYEVKNVNDEWVIKFSCEDYTLYVTSGIVSHIPYIFTCTREFTEAEMEFFNIIGEAKVIENEEESTYTVYFK